MRIFNFFGKPMKVLGHSVTGFVAATGDLLGAMAVSLVQGVVYNLVAGATAPATGTAQKVNTGLHKSVVFYGATGSGTGAAHLDIFGSLTGAANTFVLLGGLDLVLGTTQTASGITLEAPFMYIRADVVSISGASASVSADLGV